MIIYLLLTESLGPVPNDPDGGAAEEAVLEEDDLPPGLASSAWRWMALHAVQGEDVSVRGDHVVLLPRQPRLPHQVQLQQLALELSR